MAVQLKSVKAGDVLSHWFDTGAMGPSEVYSRVLRVGKKKIRVRTETGDEGWKYAEFFHRIVPVEEVQQLKIHWR